MDKNKLILLNGNEYVDIATLADQRGIPLISVHKPSLSTDNQGGRSRRTSTVLRHPRVVQQMIKEGR